MTSPSHFRTPPTVRRGSTYILVLGTALIVTVLGLTAIVATRLGLRADERSADARQASLLALAAVEHGLATIEASATWRSDHTHGVESSKLALGAGEISFRMVDQGPNGRLDDAETIRVFGIGKVGEAVRVHSVQLSTVVPLSCLGAALHAGGDVDLDGAVVDGDQVISTNGNCNGNGNSISPDVEARGSITGGTYNGAVTPLGPGRAMPDPATVFDYYIANGTPIDFTDLPWSSSMRRLERVVLSPTSNPFGGGVTNPEGIYVIDCGGSGLNVRRSRIVGTLVLLNVSSSSYISADLHMQPAVPNYPTLMVRGPMELRYDKDDPLDEAGHGVNFNPVGAPYRGAVDDDLADELDTAIEGLVYITGNVVIDSYPPRTDGVVVVGGTFTYWALGLVMNYDPVFVRNPPPGFRGIPGPMAVTPGSWRWESAD